jgi:hypothetical protein
VRARAVVVVLGRGGKCTDGEYQGCEHCWRFLCLLVGFARCKLMGVYPNAYYWNFQFGCAFQRTKNFALDASWSAGLLRARGASSAGAGSAQGGQGTWNRRARGTSGHLRGRAPAPQGRRRQAPQDRRRLTFFWGWVEMRRIRLWLLKVVLDALRVRAAQYKTRPSQAERARSRKGGSSGGQGRQPAPGEPQGPRGWNRRALEPRGGLKCTNCRA